MRSRVGIVLALAGMLALTIGGIAQASQTQIVVEPFDSTSWTPGTTWDRGGSFTPSVVNDAAQTPENALRVTSTGGGLFGWIMSKRAQPTSAGLDITFYQAQWGGTGADGMTFFLKKGSDATTTVGGAGGYLGYLPGTEGLSGALLGIGLDRFGTFSGIEGASGCSGNFAAGSSNRLVLRGPGQGTTGYCMLAPPVALDLSGSSRAAAQRKIRIVIDPSTNAGPKVTVYVNDEERIQVAQPAELVNEPTFKFGFAASTGGATNNHEIWGVDIKSVVPLPDVSFTTTTLADGAVGSAYTETIATRNGVAPVTYAVSAGSLPPGLTLDASTGAISGTPTRTGSWEFSVSATDSRSPSSTATREFTVDVVFGPPTITAVTPGDGQLSIDFTAPSDGGSAVPTTYEYSFDGTTWNARGAGGAASPLVITGLSNGTSYPVRIRAIGAAGAGTASNIINRTPFVVRFPTNTLDLRPTAWRPLSTFMTPPAVPNIEGFSGTVRATLTATNARVRISAGTTADLTSVTGYPSANWTNGAVELAFDGTEAQLNAALATLEAIGTTAGQSATIEIAVSPTGGAFNPATGHFYEFVNSDGSILWPEARCKAKYTNGTYNASSSNADKCDPPAGQVLTRRTLNGLNGYLATVTSLAENEFIGSKTGGAAAWIGGTDQAVEGAWRWADGPEAGKLFLTAACGQGVRGECAGGDAGTRFNYWNDGEPNDSSGEDALQMLAGGTGRWNDLNTTSHTQPYVVEYGGDGGSEPNIGSATATGDVRAAPITTLAAVSDLTTTGVTLNGSVNPSGSSTTAEWTVGTAADLAGGTSTAVGGTMTGSSAISVPLALTDLVPNTLYRYRLSATSSIATDTSLIATITTLPPTPTGVSVTRGDTELVVDWSLPEPTGGASVTWTASTTPSSATCTSSGTTCTITGLTNGTSYTVTVRGANAGGSGGTSTPSSPGTPAAAPDAPTIGAPTYGDASATATWTAPVSDGGAAIIDYTVTASPGGATCTASAPATTCNVTGLTNGTAYTFAVVARNAAGTSPPSAASATVIPLGPPRSPTGVQAVAGIGLATVTWTAPDDGGTPITGYTVTASPGGQACTWSSGPLQCVVTGLTNGVAYTFTVTAANAEGTGPASAATGPVTPKIGTVTPEEVEELVENSTNVSRDGSALIALACGVTVGVCQTNVTIRIGGREISTTSGTLDAGASSTVALSLPRDVQRRIARTGSQRVIVTITIESEAGTISVQVPILLEAPPAERATEWDGRPRTDGSTDLTAQCVGTFVSRCSGEVTLYVDAPAGAQGRQGGRIVVGTAPVAGPAGTPISVNVRLNRTGRALLAKQRDLRVAPEVLFAGDTAPGKISPYRIRLMSERDWLRAALRTLWTGGRPRLDLNMLLDSVRAGTVGEREAAARIERDLLKRREAGLRRVRELPAPPARLAPIERDLILAFEQSIAANRHYVAYLRTGSDRSWTAAWQTSRQATATKTRLMGRFQTAGRRTNLTIPAATNLWP